jgi:hypothetical protein
MVKPQVDYEYLNVSREGSNDLFSSSYIYTYIYIAFVDIP